MFFFYYYDKYRRAKHFRAMDFEHYVCHTDAILVTPPTGRKGKTGKY